jgi:hypothetical protein
LESFGKNIVSFRKSAANVLQQVERAIDAVVDGGGDTEEGNLANKDEDGDGDGEDAQSQMRVYVHVFGARGLSRNGKGKSGALDTYCSVSFDGSERRTVTVPNTSDPSWQQCFSFVVEDFNTLMRKCVNIKVWSDESIDKELGRVELNDLSNLPGSLVSGDNFELLVNKDDDQNGKPDVSGHIKLDVYFSGQPRVEAFNLRAIAAANVIKRPIYIASGDLICSGFLGRAAMFPPLRVIMQSTATHCDPEAVGQEKDVRKSPVAIGWESKKNKKMVALMRDHAKIAELNGAGSQLMWPVQPMADVAVVSTHEKEDLVVHMRVLRAKGIPVLHKKQGFNNVVCEVTVNNKQNLKKATKGVNSSTSKEAVNSGTVLAEWGGAAAAGGAMCFSIINTHKHHKAEQSTKINLELYDKTTTVIGKSSRKLIGSAKFEVSTDNKKLANGRVTNHRIQLKLADGTKSTGKDPITVEVDISVEPEKLNCLWDPFTGERHRTCLTQIGDRVPIDYCEHVESHMEKGEDDMSSAVIEELLEKLQDVSDAVMTGAVAVEDLYPGSSELEIRLPRSLYDEKWKIMQEEDEKMEEERAEREERERVRVEREMQAAHREAVRASEKAEEEMMMQQIAAAEKASLEEAQKVIIAQKVGNKKEKALKKKKMEKQKSEREEFKRKKEKLLEQKALRKMDRQQSAKAATGLQKVSSEECRK